MKFLKQFSIILLISCLGELLNALIPLPIPSGIYGMIILFVMLLTGIIKLKDVQETGKLLLQIMPVMFIPSAVGIMSQVEQLQSIWLEIMIITIVTTFIVMGVSGGVTQIIIRFKRKRKDKK